MLRKLLVASAALMLSTAGAHASLVADGVTYTLTETPTSSSLTDIFSLQISGINGTLDTEGGRSGVQSFAFTTPTNFVSATAPTGFTEQEGGLNSSGCNGSGGFFCSFYNSTIPATPALAANTILNYTFDVTLSSGNFTGYVPDFKINWVGNKNNYDLVSKPLDPTPGTVPVTPVPEPASFLMLGTGLLGLGLVMRRRRRA